MLFVVALGIERRSGLKQYDTQSASVRTLAAVPPGRQNQ